MTAHNVISNQFKFLKHYTISECRAPAYSRALSRIREVIRNMPIMSSGGLRPVVR